MVWGGLFFCLVGFDLDGFEFGDFQNFGEKVWLFVNIVKQIFEENNWVFSPPFF